MLLVLLGRPDRLEAIRILYKVVAACVPHVMQNKFSLCWQYGNRDPLPQFCSKGGAAICVRALSKAVYRIWCTACDISKIENHDVADSMHCNGAGAHAVAVRTHINKLCAQLAADAGKLALLMCEGFGIPDHLLQAPIAFNWQQIGTGWKQV